MKYIVCIKLIFLSLSGYCQCEINSLSKRFYCDFKSAQDKKINIQMDVKNNKLIIKDINAEITELKEYIKKCLNEPKRPAIEKYIADMYFEKKQISTCRIKETDKLDKLTFIFICFMQDEYEKIKLSVLSSDHTRIVADRISALYGEIDRGAMPKLMEIDKEMIILGKIYGAMN